MISPSDCLIAAYHVVLKLMKNNILLTLEKRFGGDKGIAELELPIHRCFISIRRLHSFLLGFGMFD
jgi:hypothetical protein